MSDKEEILYDVLQEFFLNYTRKKRGRIIKSDLTKEEAKEKVVDILAFSDWCGEKREDFIKSIVQWRLAEDGLGSVRVVEDNRQVPKGAKGGYKGKTIFLKEDIFKYKESLHDNLATILHELRHNYDYRVPIMKYKKGKGDIEVPKLVEVGKKFIKDSETAHGFYVLSHYEKLARLHSFEQGRNLIESALKALEKNPEDAPTQRKKELLYARDFISYLKGKDKGNVKRYQKNIDSSWEKIQKNAQRWQRKTLDKNIRNFKILKSISPKLKPLKDKALSFYDEKTFNEHIMLLYSFAYSHNEGEMRRLYDHYKENHKGYLPKIVNNALFKHTSSDLDDVAQLYIYEYGKDMGLYFMFHAMSKIQGQEIIESYYRNTEDVNSIALTLSIIDKQKENKYNIVEKEKTLKEMLDGKYNPQVCEFRQSLDNISMFLFEYFPMDLAKEEEECMDNYITCGAEILRNPNNQIQPGRFMQFMRENELAKEEREEREKLVIDIHVDDIIDNYKDINDVPQYTR